MIHFVIEMIKLQIRHVDQPLDGRSHHMRFDGRHRVVVHFACLSVRLAGLDPRLEQILVEAVAQRAQRHVNCERVRTKHRF